MSIFKKLLSTVPTKNISEVMEVVINEDSDDEDDLKTEYIYSKINFTYEIIIQCFRSFANKYASIL